MTNTEILCWVLGWQGGTLQQVADELQTSESSILAAEGEALRDLCRLAQLMCRRRYDRKVPNSAPAAEQQKDEVVGRVQMTPEMYIDSKFWQAWLWDLITKMRKKLDGCKNLVDAEAIRCEFRMWLEQKKKEAE